mgnify:CR=1 FL=1
MKAWILEDISNISLQDRGVPLLGQGEARIRVKACGICGSDIPRIYQNGAHNMPLVPGHEFAGVVEGIGKEVNNYWLGKRVAVCPKIPCGSCVNCKKGSPNGCLSYDYSGSRRDGAYAEYVCVPATQLIELPDRVSFEEGAMLEPLAVATNAVRRGCISNGYITPKDASIVVCGAGTIGLMVVMLLKEMGYRNVCVIGNKDIQKKQVASLGILPEYFCDKRVENPIDWLKHKSGGVDVYFECVGSNESINYALESLAFESKLVLVGNPRSDMTFSRDTYWNILRNQINLIGIWNSSFTQQELEEAAYGDDWHFALRLIEEGRIEPKMLISHKFTIDELDKGLILMRDKIEDYTKVMMINE